ncbi:MAG: hypothetical protein GY750_11045 [Lentisphaerae bacterium]|nr:hypothetical protein [Lentisphaerota bacterium]MCP4101948.1 hypothetical protein [Lentisphaerota bacterium]
MKKHYSISKGSKEDQHEVHTEGCKYLPDVFNREYLGYYSTPQEAVDEANLRHGSTQGCGYCCTEYKDEM